MDILLDIEYAKRIKQRLQLSTVTANRPFKLNFRCPICGDSKKNKNLTRGWIYEGTTGKTKGVLLFNCFNCNNNGKGAVPFSMFLNDLFPAIYEDYRVEKFKQSIKSNSEKRLVKTQDEDKPIVESASLDILTKSNLYRSIPQLPLTHPIRKYVDARCIPENKQHLLGFTNHWRKLANIINPGTFSEAATKFDKPRLVIPIYNKDGLVAIQGRAILPDDNPRYQIVKHHESFQKIYGLERIDETQLVIYVEGAIDSLFVENCCAISGGFSSLDIVPFKGNRAWALDNEPRKVDTVNRMSKIIKANEPIVIWDKLPVQLKSFKDINDMIKKGGCEISFINQYIRQNLVSGLEANLRFNQWKKI